MTHPSQGTREGAPEPDDGIDELLLLKCEYPARVRDHSDFGACGDCAACRGAREIRRLRTALAAARERIAGELERMEIAAREPGVSYIPAMQRLGIRRAVAFVRQGGSPDER